MVPMTQQDYIRYVRMLRSDPYRGCTAFRSIIENPNMVDILCTTPSACSAVFTDAGRSSVDGMLAEVLAEQPDKYDAAYNTYMHNAGISDLTVDSIVNSATNMLAYERNKRAVYGLEHSPNYLSKVATLRNNFNALNDLRNTDVTYRAAIQTQYNAARSVPSEHDITAAVNSYMAGQSTYNSYEQFKRVYVKSLNCILVGMRLRLTTNYYQAGVAVYSIATKQVTQLAVCATQSISTSADYCKRDMFACPMPAYDESTGRLYMFYRSTYNSSYLAYTAVYCTAGTLTLTSFTQELNYQITYINQTSYDNDQYGIYCTAAGGGKATVAVSNSTDISSYYVYGFTITGVTASTTTTTLAALNSSYNGNRDCYPCYANITGHCAFAMTYYSSPFTMFLRMPIFYPNTETGMVGVVLENVGLVPQSEQTYPTVVKVFAGPGVCAFLTRAKISSTSYSYFFRVVANGKYIFSANALSAEPAFDIKYDPFLKRTFYSVNGVAYCYDATTDVTWTLPSMPTYVQGSSADAISLYNCEVSGLMSFDSRTYQADKNII